MNCHRLKTPLISSLGFSSWLCDQITLFFGLLWFWFCWYWGCIKQLFLCFCNEIQTSFNEITLQAKRGGYSPPLFSACVFSMIFIKFMQVIENTSKQRMGGSSNQQRSMVLIKFDENFENNCHGNSERI